jgi:hypothetical protein
MWQAVFVSHSAEAVTCLSKRGPCSLQLSGCPDATRAPQEQRRHQAGSTDLREHWHSSLVACPGRESALSTGGSASSNPAVGTRSSSGRWPGCWRRIWTMQVRPRPRLRPQADRGRGAAGRREGGLEARCRPVMVVSRSLTDRRCADFPEARFTSAPPTPPCSLSQNPLPPSPPGGIPRVAARQLQNAAGGTGSGNGGRGGNSGDQCAGRRRCSWRRRCSRLCSADKGGSGWSSRCCSPDKGGRGG